MEQAFVSVSNSLEQSAEAELEKKLFTENKGNRCRSWVPSPHVAEQVLQAPNSDHRQLSLTAEMRKKNIEKLKLEKMC
jgi:hypothetical protein